MKFDYKKFTVAALVMQSIICSATELRIATVNNEQMIEMRKHSKYFEDQNKDVKLIWELLDESTLRKKLAEESLQRNSKYDVITIGMYEVPIWAKNGLLVEFKPDANYDVDDLLYTIRLGLSYNGKLYAAPFYGESSFIMYRTDLVRNKDLWIEDRPSWKHIREVASKIHDPAHGVYGVCLRGKPGWGDNIAIISTIANTFGAQWFDMKWKPSLDSDAWRNALNFYVELLRDFGPPNPASLSFKENLQLFKKGKCGIWIDATSFGGAVSDPKDSGVAENVGFRQSPVAVTSRGANWLWAWSFAVPTGAQNQEAAKKFLTWATSKEYIGLVGRESGLYKMPSGTRGSTYDNPKFLQTVPYAGSELRAIHNANPRQATLPASPYLGIQFASIPEFPAIGEYAGQQFASALSGQKSTESALKAVQEFAEKEMKARKESN